MDASKNLAESWRFLILCRGNGDFSMRGEPGFFDIDVRLGELSAKGDDLERLKSIVDFEIFGADWERAVPRADRAKGGRPPYDHGLLRFFGQNKKYYCEYMT
jgi:hypothetical protein